jgi:hypothetical protein
MTGNGEESFDSMQQALLEEQQHQERPSNIMMATETATSCIDHTESEHNIVPTTEITTTPFDQSKETVEPQIESITAKEYNDLPIVPNMNEEHDNINNRRNIVVVQESGEDIPQSTVETHSDGISSFPVNDDEKQEESDHLVDFITTGTDFSRTDEIVAAENPAVPETPNNISPQETAVKSDDIRNSINHKDEVQHDGTKVERGMTLMSFMAGERPTTTETEMNAPENAASTPKVIKPRAQNPVYYKSHGIPASSTATVNGFTPKATLQSTRPSVAMGYGGQIPDDSFNLVSKSQRKQHQNAVKNVAIKEMLSNVGKKLLVYTKLQPRLPNQLNVLGDHLIAQGENMLPKSTWVHLEGISPVSSLEAVLNGIQHALDIEEANGIVDLDATWNETLPIPILSLSSPDPASTDDMRLISEPTSDESITTKPHKWVQKAKLIISPFARPTGWYLQFANRSIVYALLRHAQERPIRSTWRPVRIKEYKNRMIERNSDPNKMENDQDPISYGNFLLNDEISDATLRVENCPYNVSEASMLNFFSRYDLKNAVGIHNNKPIQRWFGTTEDGKVCPPTTYLVHFADASWARAALREKQGTYMYKMGQAVISIKNPKPLHLVQYPRQIL